MIDELKGGGEPVFDSKGNVKGVYHEGGLMGGKVYTGQPEYGPTGAATDAKSAYVPPQRDNLKGFAGAQGAVAVMEAVSSVAHRKQKLI